MNQPLVRFACIQTMLSEGWIRGTVNPKRPRPQLTGAARFSGSMFHENRDPLPGEAPPASIVE